jgi:hypothetical protein
MDGKGGDAPGPYPIPAAAEPPPDAPEAFVEHSPLAGKEAPAIGGVPTASTDDGLLQARVTAGDNRMCQADDHAVFVRSSGCGVRWVRCTDVGNGGGEDYRLRMFRMRAVQQSQTSAGLGVLLLLTVYNPFVILPGALLAHHGISQRRQDAACPRKLWLLESYSLALGLHRNRDAPHKRAK